jgi:hypothetical protein
MGDMYVVLWFGVRSSAHNKQGKTLKLDMVSVSISDF